MVRPNQIISSDVDEGKLTFIMFARSEKTVKRRVLFLNFPRTILDTNFRDKSIDDYIANVKKLSEGRVNRYAVTIDTTEI